jgi:hypothetical protein
MIVARKKSKVRRASPSGCFLCESNVRNNSGFALITVLLIMVLLTSMTLYLSLMIAHRSTMTAAAETQLHSVVLAENGIEYARTLLPHVDLDQLLSGPDGIHSGTSWSEWRNPMPFASARRLDPSFWTVSRDDGWPSLDNQLLLPSGYPASGAPGYFYLRFSNNPEEPPDKDQDRVVVVRSLGLVPSRIGHAFPHARNDLTLVEALFRQERVFELEAALVLFGDSGEFEWSGDDFQVRGGIRPAVGVVAESPLESQLRTSWSAAQALRLTGTGGPPSVEDQMSNYRESPVYRRVFEVSFWQHFLENVSGFTDTRQPGLFYYPNGGSFTGSWQGILAVRGDCSFSEVEVDGLLLHLGGGRLVIDSGASMRGAVWMSNVQVGEDQQMTLGPVRLRVSGSACISYDASSVRRALALVPPTQLGWRILFPEMRL